MGTKALALASVLISSIAFGQLAVKTQSATQVVGLQNAEKIGEGVFVDAGIEIKKTSVVLVIATTDASNITFEASDEKRLPVEFQQLTPTTISIGSAGKTWVDVTCIDFKKNIYDRKTVVVQVDSTPDPVPQPQDEIDDTYGVGNLAYKKAPKESRGKVANTYRKAADFLYGRPSAKTIEQAIEWLNAELTLVTNASDPWRAWQFEIDTALMESQRTRNGFTRDDWYAAFLEITKALEAK